MPGKAPKSLLSDTQNTKLFAFFFLLPSLFFVGLIALYPLVTGLSYSFREGTMLQMGGWVGLKNYIRVFSLPSFAKAVRFSVMFSLFSVIGSYTMGLGLALLLNSDIPGRNFFRAAILIPWIIPSVVSVVAWRWLLGDQSSLINTALGFIGIKPILFLADPFWATVSVSVVKIWRSFPFMMVSILAVLQTIPAEQYEAATLDGAGSVQSFRYVTWPNLRSITIVCAILMTIWSVNDFDTIYLLTSGGPFDFTQNIINLSYKTAFVKNDIAASSAMAIIAMVAMMILSVLMQRAQKDQNL